MKKEWSFFYVFFIAGFCPVVFRPLFTALYTSTAILRTNITFSPLKPLQPFIVLRQALIVVLPAGAAGKDSQLCFPALLQLRSNV